MRNGQRLCWNPGVRAWQVRVAVGRVDAMIPHGDERVRRCQEVLCHDGLVQAGPVLRQALGGIQQRQEVVAPLLEAGNVRVRPLALATGNALAAIHQEADDKAANDRHAQCGPWIFVHVIIGGARGFDVQAWPERLAHQREV